MITENQIKFAKELLKHGLIQAPGVYGKVDDGESLKLLNKALEIGCNFWDTAGESTFCGY